jgi:hypothetical protein
LDNITVLRNAASLIAAMDLAGIKGAQAALVAETLAGLHRLAAASSAFSPPSMPPAPFEPASAEPVSPEVASAEFAAPGLTPSDAASGEGAP